MARSALLGAVAAVAVASVAFVGGLWEKPRQSVARRAKLEVARSFGEVFLFFFVWGVFFFFFLFGGFEGFSVFLEVLKVIYIF